MSDVGSCYDNAVAESFFGLLKRERGHRRRYRTRAEARVDIFDYIERFYNRRRRHSYTNGVPPAEYARSRDGLPWPAESAAPPLQIHILDP
jgi:putative transposase